MTIAPPAAVGKGGYLELLNLMMEDEMLGRAAQRPHACLTCLIPNSAYGNNAETRVSMAATITAHNPSEISDITISASPALNGRCHSEARWNFDTPCWDRRMNDYERSEAVSLSNGSSPLPVASRT
jgi:hypothetical protein